MDTAKIESDSAARCLNVDEFAHFGLEVPLAFVQVNLEQVGISTGTYNVQRGYDFVRLEDATTLQALLEFLSGVSQVSTGDTFNVPARNLVKCMQADGSVVSYNLHRDNRFA